MDDFFASLKEFCKTYEFDESQLFIQSPVGKGNPFYGCKHDEDTRKHLSKMQSTKKGKVESVLWQKT